MPNPVIVECPADEWTLVAADAKGGRIQRVKTTPNKYAWTYRIPGDPAPTSPAEGIAIFHNPHDINLQLPPSSGIDVYIYPYEHAGSVRADVLIEFADVAIQDQTTPVIDLYAFIEGGTFALAAAVAIDDTQFTAVDVTGMQIGAIVCFQELSFFMQAIILNIIGNLVIIDTPFDYPFTTSGGCSYGSKNLAVDGSVTPIIARVGPGNLSDNVEWDIVRALFSITDQTAMDDAKFGGIPALAKGIVLRTKNGITKNIFNVKTNGQFRLRNFDAEYTDRAPAGFFGFSSRRTFGGQDKNGVVLRLKAGTNDQIQIIIQDNLTALDSFEVMIQGHQVD